jgi:hypothetical protein
MPIQVDWQVNTRNSQGCTKIFKITHPVYKFSKFWQNSVKI